MESIEHLRQMFVYNDWANRRIVASVRDTGSDKARRVLAHLLITESEYFGRLHGKDSTGFDFWPDLSSQQCSDLEKENAQHFEGLLARFDDEGLGLRAEYRTSEGVACSNTFRELLTHVLVHSATHRGNIIVTLRADGLVPPKVDYIIYLRENS